MVKVQWQEDPKQKEKICNKNMLRKSPISNVLILVETSSQFHLLPFALLLPLESDEEVIEEYLDLFFFL